MSEIERLAKVLADRSGAETGTRPSVEPYWPPWVGTVRAVLQAMREPSESMCDAGSAVPGGPGFCDEPGDPPSVDEIWQAMIDDALGVERPKRDFAAEEEAMLRLSKTMRARLPSLYLTKP